MIIRFKTKNALLKAENNKCCFKIKSGGINEERNRKRSCSIKNEAGNIEAEDGIVIHLGKEKCSCPIAAAISKNADMLCECTRGHEKTIWSTFFDKPVEVEIVESFLRGGKDCVIKIII